MCLRERIASLLPWTQKKDHMVTGNDAQVRDLVAMMAKRSDTFNANICVEDEMYITLKNIFNGNAGEACTEYFRTGRQMIDLVSQVVRKYFDDYTNLSSFLEFACGYGRFTRYLVEELPADRIWGADIYPEAVGFQKREFGVNGIVSTKRPEDFTSNKKFDFIFVASLFSHLPEDTFRGWLRRLYELLAPGGILLFSVHDIDLIPPGHTMPDKGILFIEESESRSLETSDYGYTYVTESFVRDVIGEITGKEPRYFRSPRSLYHCQCVYIITNDTKRNIADLTVCPGPLGAVDNLVLHDDSTLELAGWATDFCGDCYVDIQIMAKGNVIGTSKPSFDRQDIVDGFHDETLLRSGWNCFVSLAELQSADRIIVKTTNSSGIERVLKIASINSIKNSSPHDAVG